MKLIIYNLLFPIAFILYLPLFLRKLYLRNGIRREVGERFGVFDSEKKHRLRQLEKPVWIHAVSVGEVTAALGFMRRWRERDPTVRFVLSTTTTTGFDLARKRLTPPDELIFSPLDFFLPVWRTLQLVRPSKLVIFEVEMWPNLITIAAKKGVPVALVNGRLSDRSARGYARLRWFFRPLFQRFQCICVQSEDDAERIKRVTGLNAPVYVCNTMKFDQVIERSADDVAPYLRRVFGETGAGERILWTAGSTHPGEEKMLLSVFRNLKQRFPGLRMILVPRHCERTPEVEEELRRQRLSWKRYSVLSQTNTENADVLLVDTTGELMNFYAAADLVFVGKSLAGNSGGHNIIEPALFAKPIIHGGRMDNFRLVVSLFKRHKASLEVNSEEELRAAVYELLNSADYRQKLGRKAHSLVENHRGAMDKTLKYLAS